MLEFACPKCSEPIKANEDQAGEKILCPKCEQEIKVPGEIKTDSAGKDDDWSVFDEEEKFIEETVAKNPEVNYRTPSDDQDPLIDNDEEALAEEEREEKAAVAEAVIRSKTFEFDGPAVSSDMTSAEKAKQEKDFEEYKKQLPPDSPLLNQGWNRDAKDTPDPIQMDGQRRELNSLRAKCMVCDSVTLVGLEKAGTVIVCADCGSDVTVQSSTDKKEEEEEKKQDWQKWAEMQDTPTESPEAQQEKQRRSKIADELFIEAPVEDDTGYGLAPAADNLLTPVTPVYIEGESDVDDEPASAGPDSPPAERVIKDKSETETSELFEEMQEEKKTEFVLVPLSKHIGSLLLDPHFLLRVVAASSIMVIGFTIYHLPKPAIIEEGDRGAMVMSTVAQFFQMWAFPFLPISLLLVSWIGQKIINATIVGDRNLPEWEGASLWEWLSNSLFVAFSFSLGLIPGMMIGGLIFVMSTEWEGFWAVPALGSITAMLVSPLAVLSAMKNQSPFLVYNKSIFDSLKKKSDAWISFYISALFVSIITGGLIFLGATENWLVVALMIIAINIGFGIYFRILGRLMGSIVTKVKKKKSKKQEDDVAAE